MEMTAQAIELFIGSKKILNDVSLQVHNKEFVGIIGPNGSGKSSFLKCVYRILQPSAGKILFNGTPQEELSFRESALQLAVVAQHNYYNFDFSVLEIVLMGRSPHKKILERDNSKDYEIAHQALKTVGLSDFSDRSFTTLSGGEQQRVILARALAQQSEYLVLDEPTNHLDIKYQLEIMDIVKSLNFTVIAALHDLNLAAMYCDKIVALKNGQVLATGSPTELLTEAFIEELYDVKSKVQLLDNGKPHIIYLPKHWQTER